MSLTRLSFLECGFQSRWSDNIYESDKKSEFRQNRDPLVRRITSGFEWSLFMQVLTHTRSHSQPLDRERTWPLDARMAMFVLEAGGQPAPNERDRSAARQPCRIIGTLC